MARFWEGVKWLVNAYKEISKSGFPLAKLGTQLVLGGLVASSVLSFSITFTDQVPLIAAFKLTVNDASIIFTVLAVCAILVGFWLIYQSVRVLNDKQAKVARVMVLGLPNVERNNFPDYLLTKLELYLARTPVFLNESEGAGVDIQQQVDCFNAEVKVNLLPKFVLHNQCECVYFGGLARIPFLVAYGSLLSNCSAQVLYFDKSHQVKRQYELLNDVDGGIELEFNTEPCAANEQGDIGIAVGLSLAVHDYQLPKHFINHTIFVKPSTGPNKNLLKNQENLARVSQAIAKQIDVLSAMPSVKQVHLFLSVQPPVAIDIGRRFQSGIHKPWVIHNFDAQQGQYTWALKLDRSGLSLCDSSELG